MADDSPVLQFYKQDISNLDANEIRRLIKEDRYIGRARTKEFINENCQLELLERRLCIQTRYFPIMNCDKEADAYMDCAKKSTEILKNARAKWTQDCLQRIRDGVPPKGTE